MILSVGLLFAACRGGLPWPEGLPPIPTLQAQPRGGTCSRYDGSEARCVLVLEADWQAMVLYAKTLCLASGQSAAACGAEPAPARP